jgi:hypothetical protein
VSQNKNSLAIPAISRAPSQARTTVSASSSMPTVRALRPLPNRTRIVPAAASISQGRNARASAQRSPARHNTTRSARFRIPVSDSAEHAASSARTSAGLSGSGGRSPSGM